MLVEPWLVRAARLHPDREALRTPQGSLDYAGLLMAARCAAGGLPEPGARVGLALEPGRDFALALHACLLRGCVAVPIDPRLAERERASLAAGCTVVLDTLPAGEPVETLPHELQRTATVVHTSGTGGQPKLVELSYGNWLWSALGTHVAMGLRVDERWLCALPLAHVGGLSILLRSAIYVTTAIVHECFEPDRVLAALGTDATVVSLVPTTLARLLDSGLANPPSLRAALIGGAPVPEHLLAEARERGVPVVETYGLTEACSQVTVAGRPLFCTRVELDADGEILVSGPTIAAAAGRALRTGDLGAWLEDGRLAVVGRKADTIVSGGENVAPAEVEAVLERHPAVAEALVRGVADAEWGEAVLATVMLREPGAVEEQALRAHCRQLLAAFKVPKAIEFAEALPRTTSGKLRREHGGERDG